MSDAGPTREEAIAEALRRTGLAPSLRDAIDAFLDRSDDDWRACCDEDCTPCVTVVGRAVDVARELLGRGSDDDPTRGATR